MYVNIAIKEGVLIMRTPLLPEKVYMFLQMVLEEIGRAHV